MAENISLTIFGTFGKPNGFTQTIAGKISGTQKLDLNPTAIQLFDTTKAMYAIRKEMLGTDAVVSFIKYSYASEQSSTRGGTFVGAAVINANGIADINSVISVLDSLHNNLISNSKNVKDGIIMVKHSNEFTVKEIDHSVLKPVPELISDIDFSEKGKYLVVFIPLANIKEIFDRALELLSEYDTIYFTEDQQVATYVQKTGFYELIQEVGDVEQFSEKLKAAEAEKALKQKAVLDSLLKDMDKVNSDKELFIKKYQEQLDKSKEIHQKNGEKISEAEKNLRQYSSSYDNQISRLKQLSQKIAGKQLKQTDRVRIEKEIRELSITFDNEKRNFSEPARLATFSEPVRPISPQRTVVDWTDDIHRKEVKRSSKRISGKEIALILGALLIIAIGGYFAYPLLNKETSANDNTTDNYAPESDSASSTTEVDSAKIDLNPTPNDILNYTDTNKTIERQFPDSELPMPIETVVLKIFKANPNQIGNMYKGKEKEYGEFLILKNPSDFDESKKLIKAEQLQFPIFKEHNADKSDTVKTIQPSPIKQATVDDLTKKQTP